MRRRDFAHFMLRQAEEEDKNDYSAIICDLRSDQRAVMNLLRFSGYEELGRTPLSDSNVEDIVMIKRFGERTESGLVYQTQHIILGN